MPKPSKRATDEFIRATVNSGGQMMMITSMGQAIESAAGPVVGSDQLQEELQEILVRRLRERPDPPSAADLETAARVLAWTTTWIGEEVFGHSPGDPPGSWVPEVRGRVRPMRDDEINSHFEEPSHGEEAFHDPGAFREAG